MQAKTRAAAAILAGALATGAWAAEPPLKSEYRLSEAEKAAILAAATERPAAPVVEAEPSAKPQPHGEVGFVIGSGGRRGFFGSFGYPIGDHSGAAVSFDYDSWRGDPER